MSPELLAAALKQGRWRVGWSPMPQADHELARPSRRLRRPPDLARPSRRLRRLPDLARPSRRLRRPPD
ncbi:MAG: hypothetical protein M3O70_24540, partial [Actinomycetota bacterium]|nr:hypothetical protein [Actinomycetota bacterium]